MTTRTVRYAANNEVTLLHSGAEYFPSLLAALDGARSEVFLETYIFAYDDTGAMVRTALARAAARGVEVNVIVDWVGTGGAEVRRLTEDLAAAGVRLRVFNPWFRHGVVRSHRKICVVDRTLAFVGGLNINDDLHCDFDYAQILDAPRWDFAVRVSGPLVERIHQDAQRQWAHLGRLDLRGRLALLRPTRAALTVLVGQPTLAGFVVRDNLRHRSTIQRAYLDAIGNAKKRVLLATPYFAPGRKFRRALARAAQRGVQVTLLLGAGQFRLHDAVAASFYPKLLRQGVHLVEYRKTQLHGKVAVVDDDWATVGSSNCDGLSLFVNLEANVVVKDPAFAKMLRSQIEAAVADGVAVRLEDYANIPWHQRLWHGAMHLAYRSLMRVVTWGNYS